MPCGIDRVGGEIEAERVALGRHALGESPRGITRQANRRRSRRIRAEQPRLTADALVMCARGMSQDRLRGREDRRPFGLDTVERTCPRKAFELPAIKEAGIDARGKILEAHKRPRPRPLLD